MFWKRFSNFAYRYLQVAGIISIPASTLNGIVVTEMQFQDGKNEALNTTQYLHNNMSKAIFYSFVFPYSTFRWTLNGKFPGYFIDPKRENVFFGKI